MTNIFLRILQRQKILPIARKYHGGESTVDILNNDRSCLFINSYNNHGFRLNNGAFVFGPMVIFPHNVISWNVGNHNDISIDTLSLFYHIYPKIDILILGLEDSSVSGQLYTKMLKLMKYGNICFEILPTNKACTTFNYIRADKKFVAGAFIPPLHMPW